MAKNAKAKSESIRDDHVEQYNKVVDRAEINSIQLVHVTFDVTPRYFEKDRKDHEIGYEVETEDSYYDSDDGFAAALVNFVVQAKDDEGITLECNGRYTVSYRLSEPCDELAVKTFLGRVGVFACYPYFRSLFASMDWAANTRLPPLPIHKENVATRPKKKSTKKAAVAKGKAELEG